MAVGNRTAPKNYKYCQLQMPKRNISYNCRNTLGRPAKNGIWIRTDQVTIIIVCFHINMDFFPQLVKTATITNTNNITSTNIITTQPGQSWPLAGFWIFTGTLSPTSTPPSEIHLTDPRTRRRCWWTKLYFLKTWNLWLNSKTSTTRRSWLLTGKGRHFLRWQCWQWRSKIICNPFKAPILRRDQRQKLADILEKYCWLMEDQVILDQ